MEQIEDRAVNEKEAAAYLGIAPITLRILRSKGAYKRGMTPIPYIKIGKAIRYSMRELVAYRDRHTFQEPAA